MTETNSIWFVTGISRGFGKAIAEALLREGDTVIGTTRDGVSPINDTTGRLHTLTLDVTDTASVRSAVSAAHEIAGRLDVILNNAGFGLLGSIEEADENDIAHMFDVNFHGTRRVVQAALPFLRRQKSGHIVNITSIAGLAPGAASGFYAASKFAVEGMTQSLAREVAPLGIKVTLVEPGAFRTDFLSDHSIRTRKVSISEYEPTAGAALKALEHMAGQQIGDPDKAAEAIIKAVRAQEPPLHLVLGSDAFHRARDMQTRFMAELDAWKDVSLGTDY
jgi:NAD(P)-dependent dehydrogenase (short-subunit alcohol dehydrogenase family)